MISAPVLAAFDENHMAQSIQQTKRIRKVPRRIADR